MFCPKKKGFFPLLYAKMKDNITDEELKTFASLDSNEQRVAFVRRLAIVSGRRDKSGENGLADSSAIENTSAGPENGLFHFVRPVLGEKCSVKSAQHREAGNAAFEAGNVKQALLIYTMAVFTAPSNKEEFSLALGNRSAALQKLKAYDLAVADIDLALKSGYPKSKVFKLLQRKAECLEAVGNYSSAASAYVQSLGALSAGAVKGAEDKKEKLRKELMGKINSLNQKQGIQVDDSSQDATEASAEQRSYLHPSVSFSYEAGRGRFAVASSDVAIGTLLVSEMPAVSALYPEHFGTHCQRCLRPVGGGRALPCEMCSWVAFCSQECRRQADADFHRLECGVLKLLIESGLNVYSFLALRLVCRAGGAEQLYALKERLQKRDEANVEAPQAPETEPPFVKDLLSVVNLVSHDSTLDRDTWLLRSLVACFLLELLKATDFFSATTALTMSERERWVGAVLLQLINVCPCNTHDISEYLTPQEGTFADTTEKVSLGAAIYARLALFNHSCNPDFMRCNSGSAVICVANRNIKKGEEICENYGLMYTAKSLSERRSVLSEHYKFGCVCRACREDWPTLSQMEAARAVGKQDKEKHNCQKESPCISCLSGEAISHFASGRWDEGVEWAARCVDAVDNDRSGVSNAPNLDVVKMQVALWKGLWIQRGSLRPQKKQGLMWNPR